MRLYSIVNMYMSGIHAGIQTAHVVSELFQKYHKNGESREILMAWASSDPTIIVLNGGQQQNLVEIFIKLKRLTVDLSYPVALFQESEEALNKAVTAVGIVLPEDVYNGDVDRMHRQQLEIYDIVSKLKLAN